MQDTRETWVQSLGQEVSLEVEMTPLQCSYLGNPLDRGEWWAYRVTESDATELVVSSTQYGGLNNLEC